MEPINALLSKRLKKNSSSPKTAALAKQSASGNLSGFAGIFGAGQLSSKEKELLQEILLQYGGEERALSDDLNSLIALTAEVKAINNQAALLHGERIKKAQKILKEYREGAFTAWLIAAYGNRQTPYNFLQYYELYASSPRELHPQIEAMPRQAVYTLASRSGPLAEKLGLIEGYRGETKAELLQKIRLLFPLSERDRRGRDAAEEAIKLLKRAKEALASSRRPLKPEQKKTLKKLLNSFETLLGEA